jgi:putative transposase
VVDVRRQIDVSETTYYTWKKKFGERGVTELQRLKMLEDENARLKRIVANLTLDKQILQEGRSKKALKAVKRRELAAWMQERFKVNSAQVVPLGAAATIGLVGKERGTRSECAAPAHAHA